MPHDTYHVLGAGGIGVALGWCLQRAGADVIVVDAHPGKVEAGSANGMTVVGHGTEHPAFVAYDEWRPPADACILLCTKTYDNPAVMSRLPDRSFLVPVQNGFDPALERRNHPGEGIASFVSECLRDRPETRITRPGNLHLGPRRDATEAERQRIAALGVALGAARLFSIELVDDVRPYKATKLMYNAAISPLAALAGIDNAELLTDRLARSLFFALLQENYAILRHAKVPLARIGPFHPKTVSRILRTPGLASLMAVFFRPSLRGTYCSMAPDIATSRTEIDAYNGHLIRLAGEFPCPINRAAHALVHRVVSERLVPSRAHLRRLADGLPGGTLS